MLRDDDVIYILKLFVLSSGKKVGRIGTAFKWCHLIKLLYILNLGNVFDLEIFLFAIDGEWLPLLLLFLALGTDVNAASSMQDAPKELIPPSLEHIHYTRLKIVLSFMIIINH
jgi:hypothetical protein